MLIKDLQINNFGKLKNREIELNNGINIIFGENESGKSTILKFITSMFYGVSKNKNGKRITDFEKYTPWYEGEYSGKIKYKLDNGEEYEVYRNFTKKNPQILDSNGNDVSKNYTIDKTYGNQFFSEQTKVDEELFAMAMTMEQQEVKLDEKKQNTLIQKLSNIMLTGEDDVSYKKILNKLIKKQTDEIGTDKSPTKPLYITKQKIEELKRNKKELESILPMQYEIEEEKIKIQEEINNGENELELMQEMQKFQNEIKVEEEAININIKSKEDLEEKKEQEENNLNNVKTKKYEKKSYNKLYIISLLLTILAIIFIILNKIILFGITLGLAIISLVTILTLNLNENKKYKIVKEVEKIEVNKLNSKIEILENEIKEKEKIILEKQNGLEIKKNANSEILKNKFSKINNIDSILKENINSQNILDEQRYLNELKLKLTRLEMQKNEIKQKSENASKIEEELENLEEELKELLEYNEAINLAIESLENANKQMKENVTPKFTENLSKAIENISDGKYKTVKVNEENGLLVETENGNYVPADVLSTGTIDQLYLSLRVSSLNELTKEKMPIILDETFAFFDSERLENVLKFLENEYGDRQILILTCTNREVEILKKLNIQFNEIIL